MTIEVERVDRIEVAFREWEQAILQGAVESERCSHLEHEAAILLLNAWPTIRSELKATDKAIRVWHLKLAEEIAEWLVSRDGGSFSDHLLDDPVLAGIARIIRDGVEAVAKKGGVR